MIWGYFEVHVTALFFSHSRDLDISAHETVQEEDAVLRVVFSHRVIFVPANISCVVIELGVDGLDAFTVEVTCRSFRLLLLSPSLSNDPARN